MRGRGRGFSTPTTYNGRLYRSKREADYARQLDQLRTARGADRVLEWRAQVPVPLTVNGARVCIYVVDFVVWYSPERVEYHEIKGFETQLWKIKEKLFRALYPDKVLKVIR